MLRLFPTSLFVPCRCISSIDKGSIVATFSGSILHIGVILLSQPTEFAVIFLLSSLFSSSSMPSCKCKSSIYEGSTVIRDTGSASFYRFV